MKLLLIDFAWILLATMALFFWNDRQESLWSFPTPRVFCWRFLFWIVQKVCTA